MASLTPAAASKNKCKTAGNSLGCSSLASWSAIRYICHIHVIHSIKQMWPTWAETSVLGDFNQAKQTLQLHYFAVRKAPQIVKSRNKGKSQRMKPGYKMFVFCVIWRTFDISMFFLLQANYLIVKKCQHCYFLLEYLILHFNPCHIRVVVTPHGSPSSFVKKKETPAFVFIKHFTAF